MRRRSTWSLLSLLMIAAVLAAACTSGNNGTTTPSGDQLDPNGAITTNTGAEPDTIDPQKESFVNEVAQTMMVYEALMSFDPKTLKPVPGAAKEARDALHSADAVGEVFVRESPAENRGVDRASDGLDGGHAWSPLFACSESYASCELLSAPNWWSTGRAD